MPFALALALLLAQTPGPRVRVPNRSARQVIADEALDAPWGDDPHPKDRLRHGRAVRVASGAPDVVEVRVVGR
jgi:hypothetical protein